MGANCSVVFEEEKPSTSSKNRRARPETEFDGATMTGAFDDPHVRRKDERAKARKAAKKEKLQPTGTKANSEDTSMSHPTKKGGGKETPAKLFVASREPSPPPTTTTATTKGGATAVSVGSTSTRNGAIPNSLSTVTSLTSSAGGEAAEPTTTNGAAAVPPDPNVKQIMVRSALDRPANAASAKMEEGETAAEEQPGNPNAKPHSAAPLPGSAVFSGGVPSAARPGTAAQPRKGRKSNLFFMPEP